MNKKVLLLWALVSILGLSASSQSVQKLDEKYGFKNFKFNTGPDEYSGLIQKQEEIWDKNPNASGYRYVGGEIDNLFNVPVEFVNLDFYKEKLFGIMVSFKEPFTKDSYTLVLYALQNLYGDGKNCINYAAGITDATGREWDGELVEMELHRVFYNSSWIGYLTISEKQIVKQKMADEF